MGDLQTFYDCLDMIDELRSTTSRLDKETIIRKWLEKNPQIKEIMYLTYNPLIKFNVRNVPVNYNNEPASYDEIINYLKKLSSQSGVKMTEIDHLSKLIGNDVKVHEMVHLILNKSFDCGVSTKTVSKFVEIPQFEPMLCISDINKLPHDGTVLSSYKLDGLRCIILIDVETQNISCMTRRGKEFSPDLLAHLTPDLKELINNKFKGHKFVMLDGELYSFHYNFEKLVSVLRRKSIPKKYLLPVQYYLFDCIVDGQNSEPLYQRLERISDINLKTITYLKHRERKIDEIDQDLKVALQHGLEGLVVKNPRSPYENKRSKHWCKIKVINSIDVYVEDIIEGTGKYEGMVGSLLCRMRNGKTFHVGSGLNDEQRVKWAENPEEIVGKVIEVKYQEMTKAGVPRFPVFLRIRRDKTIRDID